MTERATLPPARTEEDFDGLDEPALRLGVRALLRDLGAGADPTRFATGSLPVYAAGPGVLKLFPQVHVEDRLVTVA